jgi:hypothetical protein
LLSHALQTTAFSLDSAMVSCYLAGDKRNQNLIEAPANIFSEYKKWKKKSHIRSSDDDPAADWILRFRPDILSPKFPVWPYAKTRKNIKSAEFQVSVKFERDLVYKRNRNDQYQRCVEDVARLSLPRLVP